MEKIVDSKCYSLKEIFSEKYDVDFYQREYVWKTKQLEDLIDDLSTEFLKNWNIGDDFEKVKSYAPYFMGEIVIAKKEGERSSIIDGQQRITTLTLFLIYILRKYGDINEFPKKDVEDCIYINDYGTKTFTISVKERSNCMKSLFENGEYTPDEKDKLHVQNIVNIFENICNFWNEKINENNVINFVYWLLNKVKFSKVWTNDDGFAYVIFETMNDRGLSLTKVEMLRSYLLANIDSNNRSDSITIFDEIIERLSGIKIGDAKNEFFKVYLRSHYCEDFSKKDNKSDFTLIGNGFHRWIRENSKSRLNLNKSNDFVDFIKKLSFYSKQYKKIYDLINLRNAKDYLYLIVNADYGFTLQPALILSTIRIDDGDDIIDEKIKLVSKYLTMVLSCKVWNHETIAQSYMESAIYLLCKKIRNKNYKELENILKSIPIEIPSLENAPILNQQNKTKLRVLLALLTEIVASNSDESNYILNFSDIEIEHIWSNHFEEHKDEFIDENSFNLARNNIGDLLLLPKSFNASYNDASYEIKVNQYFSQNILAQSLNSKKYVNNPGFIKFKNNSGLEFKSYDDFKYESIIDRANLYKNILIWNFKEFK